MLLHLVQPPEPHAGPFKVAVKRVHFKVIRFRYEPDLLLTALVPEFCSCLIAQLPSCAEHPTCQHIACCTRYAIKNIANPADLRCGCCAAKSGRCSSTHGVSKLCCVVQHKVCYTLVC
jgi:hypothetical protein